MTEDNIQLLEVLNNKFIIEPADFKTLDNQLKLKISIEEESSPNELLTYLSDKAQIVRFNEVIPSVNEIFIKTVTENE